MPHFAKSWLRGCFNFLRTGYYFRSNGAIYDRISRGYNWSDTSSTSANSYTLGTGLDYSTPTSKYYRGYGFTVRCVVREGCKEESLAP